MHTVQVLSPAPAKTPQEMPHEKNQTVVILLAVLLMLLLIANVALLYISSRINTDNAPAPRVTATVAPTQSTGVTPMVVAGRLRIDTPLAGSTVPYTGGELHVSGQMKDFFEGTLHFSLTNANGITLYSDVLTVNSNNYGQFASFDGTFTLPVFPFSNYTATANLNFYEEDMRDEAQQTLLLSVPVILD